MFKVAAPDELMEAVGQIDRRGTQFTTSLFAAPEQIRKWLNQASLQYASCPDCILLARRSGGIFHLYHVAKDESALSHALASLDGDCVWVADLIAQANRPTAGFDSYSLSGFEHRATLTRMVRLERAVPPGGDRSQVEFAQIGDVLALRNFLCNLLNPLVDQIPEVIDLREAVESQELLVVRDGDNFKGILLFERTGKLAHLRYWYVAKGLVDRGIGGRLMKVFLDLCRDCQRVILWTIADNSNAIGKYEHFGFCRENMIDLIMVRMPSRVQHDSGAGGSDTRRNIPAVNELHV